MRTGKTEVRSVLLMAVLLLISTAIGWAAKPERMKKKEISKSFNVGSGDVLRTDNRYGHTTITHWDKNEVLIRVEIEAKAESEEAAQAMIDRVEIEMMKSGNTVSAVTSLRQQNHWKGNSNERFAINYFISMPSDLDINLMQKYGNINLPANNGGNSTIQIKYGNLNAGSFTKPLNVEAKYGNLDINNVVKGYLDIGYCGTVALGKVNQLTADCKYSNLKIRECEQLNLENKYGNVNIGSLDKGNIEIKYSEATIGNVKESLNVGELAYGTLNIEKLSAHFTNVDVDARYGNLNVHVPADASFKIYAEEMKYGNRRVKGFNITNSSTEDKVNHYYEINGGKKGHIYFNGNNYSNISVEAL